MHYWKHLLFAIALTVLVAGCNTEEPESREAQEGQDETAATEQGEETFPLTLIDASGKEVLIEEEPETIVSLMPSNTEILYAIGAGEKLIGRSEYDNYPEEVIEIESIGGLELDIERIIELDPDLVLAHASAEAGLEQIRGAGIQVAVVNNANSFEEAYDSIELIGTATGTTEQAEALIEDIQGGLATISEKASAISEEEKAVVWLEISDDLYTAGSGTFMEAFLELIQAENVAAQVEGWAPFSEEGVIASEPDVIIITYSYIENAVEAVKNRSGWEDVPAITNDRVYQVNEDLLSRPGPRLVEGAEELAAQIYPEVFEN